MNVLTVLLFLATPRNKARRALFWLLWLSAVPALASHKAAGPGGPVAPSLAQALNPDGTLRPGAQGSFDARQFTLGTAPDGRPTFRPAGTAGTGDHKWQDGFGMVGADAYLTSVVQSGTNIYVGGAFTILNNVLANRVARWNGSAWSALGAGNNNGVDSYVLSMAVAPNGDLYVGGLFNQAGGVPAAHVARWNGSAWNSLGSSPANGVDGSVTALAVAATGDVYVGGSFTQAGGSPARNIARWSGTAWSSLGTGPTNGVNNAVQALVLTGPAELYAGGDFSEAGGATANKVARWNGQSWSQLGTGSTTDLNRSVRALLVAGNGDLYAAGDFTHAGFTPVNGVARWNGTAWLPLGTGLTQNAQPGYGTTLVLAGNGDVCVGGLFSQAGGVSATSVARWNGTSWGAIGSGPGSELNSQGVVCGLAVAPSGSVCAVGFFYQAGGVPANHLASWNGTAWRPLGNATGNGVNNILWATAVAANGDVYVGGSFSQVGGVPANSIAKWNGTTWTALDSGLSGGAVPASLMGDATAAAIAIASNGDVYVGGEFTRAGGLVANNIAKWNGSTWSALSAVGGSANAGINLPVEALAVAGNGDVYAGGKFTRADGLTVNGIARWNGSTWSALGSGLSASTGDGYVRVLAIAGNGNVYVGGRFDAAGGVAASNIARWDGTAWSALGSGVSRSSNGYSDVRALALTPNGDLFVGGGFNRAGGNAARNIARWDGTAWSPLSSGATNGVNTTVASLLAMGNGDIYVGGFFGEAGGAPLFGIARWNGTAWSSLGTGLNGAVGAIALSPTGKICVGGNFTAVGDGSKPSVSFAVYDPAAIAGVEAAATLPALYLYPNPAAGTVLLTLGPGPAVRPVRVLDALGRLVRTAQLPAHAGSLLLNVADLPAGNYTVRCGEVSTRLVVE